MVACTGETMQKTQYTGPPKPKKGGKARGVVSQVYH